MPDAEGAPQSVPLASSMSLTMSLLTSTSHEAPRHRPYNRLPETVPTGNVQGGNKEADVTENEGTFQLRGPSELPDWRGNSRLGGLVNTVRLWNVVTPCFSYANLTLLFAASMTICAQILLPRLPVYIGRATKELTGGSSGEFADREALSSDLALAFMCIFMYVSLRGGTTVLIMLIGLRWRYNLTRTLHSLYFTRKAYYHVNDHSTLDNVDSRFASDLSTFIKLCCGGVSPPLASTYVGIIADIFLVITASMASIQRTGSRITAFAYIYNAVTILVAVLLSLPIARTTERQEKREADYRYTHMRVKTYSEQIALLQGEDVELAELDKRLDALVVNQRSLIFQYFRLGLANTFSGVGGSLFGLLIASLTLYSKRLFFKFDIEELTMMLGTIEILSSACQALPDKLPMLTSIAGLSKRIVELFDALEFYANHPMPEHLCLQRPATDATSPDCEHGGLPEPEFKLSVANLSYSTPGGQRQLARGLNFTVELGMGVVIRGPSGCGKTSLLRCIAGLWSADEGLVTRPVADMKHGICFMPQRPYMPTGSLRQQVVYPDLGSSRTMEQDLQIAALLREVGLVSTLDSFGLDGMAVWEDVCHSPHVPVNEVDDPS
mmetsp:Transcript_38562/g.101741  ORF Transcript_38562/g.101741 Transcript_38562/m.101741 type:complete len:609 (-) Transcript_38562:800-2626(-)